MSRLRLSTYLFCIVVAIASAGCGPGTVSQGLSPQTAAVSAPSTRRGARNAPSQTTDWDSFGYDLQRTGYNPSESIVGASNVGNLQKLWSVNVGFGMVHEPVLATGVYINSQARNVLYAGSANGAAMYAIDANTGSILWQHAVPRVRYYCFSQRLLFSIGETPAIDRGKNLLYFSDGENQVHAVDLATGTEAGGWPVKIAHYRGDRNFMHGGLTYNPSNGLLYAVTGSTCDISPWYGRIVAISTTGPSIAGTFYTTSGTSKHGSSGGGIWGPGGASIDANTNNVFVATGNADTSQGQAQNAGYAEQVIELSPTLGTIVANNYPPNIPLISGDSDFDFGATPLLFQPYGCPLMLAAVNKSGIFELYDVGSIVYGPIQAIAMSIPTDKGNFVGVPAFDPVTGYVYVGLPATEGIYRPGLAAFSIKGSTCTLNPTPVWNAQFGPDGAHVAAQTPRSPLSIANGVVYVANYGHKTEFAFDAATGAQLWSDPLSDFGDVGTVIANGIVYVSARDGTITAWAPPGSKSKKRKLRQNR
ncbi:MAG: PQQ-binding-like beta-propeller repeat protein [Candidatus Cybelea sp.]